MRQENEAITLRKLETQFTKKGVSYRQIYNDNRWYIYECISNYAGIKDTYYEVFKRRNEKDRVCKNGVWSFVENQRREMYPTDEAFGEWAWCCNTIDRVYQKMKEKNQDSE